MSTPFSASTAPKLLLTPRRARSGWDEEGAGSAVAVPAASFISPLLALRAHRTGYWMPADLQSCANCLVQISCADQYPSLTTVSATLSLNTGMVSVIAVGTCSLPLSSLPLITSFFAGSSPLTTATARVAALSASGWIGL